ncbi:MAG: extracellular solute-binding protein, partial [Clostridia bacterium]|nr:extracellular solute-binding protein [Clostridia bacterium]
MKTRKIVALVLVAMMVVSVFAACGKTAPAASASPSDTSTPSESASATPEASAAPATIKGEITFVHNRTDRNETTFPQYIKKFNEKYPDITVKLETMTDYEGQIKIRMGTADYGDVLLAPNMDPATYADFFLPLGDKETLSQQYRFMNKCEYKGTVYGLPVFGAANGIVYNKRIFQEAGITALPKSVDEFIADLKLIKEKTKAIPMYTNYAAGWPLGGQWEGPRGSFTNDFDWQTKLAHD